VLPEIAKMSATVAEPRAEGAVRGAHRVFDSQAARPGFLNYRF